jgi:hypothetical protein
MLMPSASKKQHNFMAAIAHNPAFAKKVGIPQSVGKDFNDADKGKKFRAGGRTDLQGVNKSKTDHGSMSLFKQGGVMKSDMKEDMKMDKAQDKSMIKKAFKQHDAQEHKGGKGTKLALKKGGAAKMADGGMTDPRAKMMMAKMGAGRAMPAAAGRAMPKRPVEAAPMMKKGGMTKMAKGGGIESKGKTKGTMIRMKSGGKAC